MTELVPAQWPLWAVALATPLTILLSIAAALVERASPIRLRSWAENGGGHLIALYADGRRFEAYRFLLGAFARMTPLALLAGLIVLLAQHGVRGPGWAVGIVALFLIVLEWLNRALVERRAEAALERLTPILRFLSILLVPLVWLLARGVPVASELEPNEADEDDDVSENELSAFIDVGRKEGILEPEEEELVRSIVDFGDTLVKSVMTPRVEIKSAPLESALEALAEVFFETKHARLPLYRDSIDHVVGILHIRDLFEALHHGRTVAPESLLKPPVFVPESKPLRDLLSELQRLHQQMAIVVDEYGGVAGLVTVEDLVEEIVGEIADEHEPADSPGERLADGVWRLAGRTHLDALHTLFGADIDDKVSYETVSGLICGELGYVPKPGETFEADQLIFDVEAANERRVTIVTVRAAVPAEAETPA